jgi:hypothetical protein
MNAKSVLIGALIVTFIAGPMVLAAVAQEKPIFIPLLSYRTGPYAPSGVPSLNGFNDYFNLLNERDGGIEGVKIVFEECEMQYDTKQGVECYERLKNLHGGAVRGLFRSMESSSASVLCIAEASGRRTLRAPISYMRSQGASSYWCSTNPQMCGVLCRETPISCET